MRRDPTAKEIAACLTLDDVRKLVARLAAEPDSIAGIERAPDRYMASGRECIDTIRDALGDHGFAAFCWGNYMKYLDRDGAKGDPAGDRQKAGWYKAMHDSLVYRGCADPRTGRPGFVPYQRQEAPTDQRWPRRFALPPVAPVKGGCER